MPSSSLEAHLRAAQDRLFVGRAEETELFLSALPDVDADDADAAAEPPFHLLYLSGPGGIGKSTLLGKFAALAAARGVPVTRLDARSFEPTPPDFLAALGRELRLLPADDPICFLRTSTRRVLFIDTFERCAPLEIWLRDGFFPQISSAVFVVVAGRDAPAPAVWRSDPGWQAECRALALRNLAPGDSRTYLERRGVTPERHRAILNFTHGFPLALSLVADAFAQKNDAAFSPEMAAASDIIPVLLERFLGDIPGPAHRRALEICALLRVTTEPLLGAMLEIDDPRPLFDWLRGLTFVESGRYGIYPHDIVRDALLADLRWRDPDRYAALHRAAHAFYTDRFAHARGSEQQRLLLDYIFLHRDSLLVRAAFEWQDVPGIFADTLRAADHDAVLALATQWEGADSADRLRRWLERFPESTTVFRHDGAVAGFITAVPLHALDAAERDADPGLAAAWAHLERSGTPLRSGETALHFRFWMARESYHAVSSVQSLIFVHVMRCVLTTPGLAVTFFPIEDADQWEPVFAYAEMKRIADADFTIGERRCGTFGNDWRAFPPTLWLAVMAEKDGGDTEPSDPDAAEPLVVLSEPEFARQVRDALAALPSADDGLNANPLLRSRFVAEAAGGTRAGRAEKAAALRTLLRDAVAALQNAAPRQQRCHPVLHHTFIEPSPTKSQRDVADRLDLPFSTYRRHLAEGIALVARALWRKEIENEHKLGTN